jgi:tRNA(fMet)-specific endonuclease VapC
VYSLDSDTVNGILKRNATIVSHIRAERPVNLWICTIVIEELVGKQVSHINTLRSQRKPLERESRFLADLIKAFSSFQILPYTDEAERLYHSWPAKQKRVGPNDCRIAASAIVAGLTVVTCNQKDFSSIPGLIWQDWSKP